MHPLIATPFILILLLRAATNKSLTPLGLLAAALTAIAHALHPWSVFFALLAVFYLTGNAATKIKADVKARLTLSSNSGGGGEGRRTHVQVFANTAVASGLILLHAWKVGSGRAEGRCWAWRGDLEVVGVVWFFASSFAGADGVGWGYSQYAAVAADTFASELGILSRERPRLITSPTLREVPPGTNGGVTFLGILAGFLGSFVIALTSVVLLPFCPVIETSMSSGLRPGFEGGHSWALGEKMAFVAFVTAWGGLGSLVDSILGALLQESVVDVRTGKVVEGRGGQKVLVTDSKSKKDDKVSSRRVETGRALLDNNGVNLAMAMIMGFGGMGVASWIWGVPLKSVLP
ncbi:hypothetical protein MMC10_008464 [Thelotrema lepadinum]|nr:hypothetical protein [Thelotrema lepadinum]